MELKHEDQPIVLANFNMGFCIDNGGGGLVPYLYDEHDEQTLLNADQELFDEFLEFLCKEFEARMEFVDNRNEDIEEILKIKPKTFDPRTLSLTNNINPKMNYVMGKHDIGNIALLSVYKKELFDRVIEHIKKNFPKEYDDVLFSGKEARNGVSVFKTYVGFCNDYIVPKFPVKA